MFESQEYTENGMRIIKTGRSESDINMAAQAGFFPVIKKVEPSKSILSKYAVYQHGETGEIVIGGDYREGIPGNGYEVVIDHTFYYPHSYELPFAAYLVPKDITVGERVYIEDLIEDFVGATWNQGDTYRLDGCEAIWTGTEFEIQYDENRNKQEYIG